MLGVRLEASLEKRLDTLARVTGRTKTYYVQRLIAEHIDDLEDIYMAQKNLEEVKSGKQKVLSSDEMWESLGL
jgi:RHH-type rel operon transcriptional repressor/antitoxin RelB